MWSHSFKTLIVEQNVQGYYEYASSRFVDNVCLTIFVDLFNKYRDGIGGKLKEDIGLTKADGEFTWRVYMMSIYACIDKH